MMQKSLSDEAKIRGIGKGVEINVLHWFFNYETPKKTPKTAEDGGDDVSSTETR